MARPILGSAPWGAALLLLGTVCACHQWSLAQSEAPRCIASDAGNLPSARQQQIRDLERRVEAGPFYRKMAHRLGKPKGCEAKLDGQNVQIVFRFREDAHLEARENSSIEYSEQRAALGGLSRAKALELLKRGVADMVGPGGCGMTWSQPQEQTEEGSRATVFRGGSCNCQGRILYRGDAVVGLEMSSAC